MTPFSSASSSSAFPGSAPGSSSSLSSDFSELVSVDAVLDYIETLPIVSASERIPLDRALHRYAFETLQASRPVPAFANSAVEGYAFRHADLQSRAHRLVCRGTLAAGAAASEAGRPLASGETMRVLTGAPLPEAADTVQMEEDTQRSGSTIVFNEGLKRGSNIRRVGEDLALGAELVSRGTRLDATRLGLLSSVGVRDLLVYRPLRVGLITTGNEILAAGETPEGETPGGRACLLDSTGTILKAACFAQTGQTVLHRHVPDVPELVLETLNDFASETDIIFTSGGMALGELDCVRAVLASQGALHLWRVAIKPGRPLGVGLYRPPPEPPPSSPSRGSSPSPRAAVPVMGFPGNPVAAYVCFLLFGRALLIRAGGGSPSPLWRYAARLNFAYRKKPGRREYLRVRVAGESSDGLLCLDRYGRSGASIVSSLAYCDGLAEVLESQRDLEMGARVRYIPLSEGFRC